MRITPALRKLLKELNYQGSVDSEVSADIMLFLWEKRAAVREHKDSPAEVKQALQWIDDYEKYKYFPAIDPVAFSQSLPWLVGFLTVTKENDVIRTLQRRENVRISRISQSFRFVFENLQRQAPNFSGDFILKLQIACISDAISYEKEIVRELSDVLAEIVIALISRLAQASVDNENRFYAFVDCLHENPTFSTLPQLWQGIRSNIEASSNPLDEEKLNLWLMLVPLCRPAGTSLTLMEELQLIKLHESLLKLLSKAQPELQDAILRVLIKSWQKMRGLISSGSFFEIGFQTLSSLLPQPLAAQALTQLELVVTTKRRSVKDSEPTVRALWLTTLYHKSEPDRETAQKDLATLSRSYPDQVLQILNPYLSQVLLKRDMTVETQVRTLKLLGRLACGDSAPAASELDLVTFEGRLAFLSKLQQKAESPELRLAAINSLCALHYGRSSSEQLTSSRHYSDLRRVLFNQYRTLLNNLVKFDDIYRTGILNSLAVVSWEPGERRELRNILRRSISRVRYLQPEFQCAYFTALVALHVGQDETDELFLVNSLYALVSETPPQQDTVEHLVNRILPVISEEVALVFGTLWNQEQRRRISRSCLVNVLEHPMQFFIVQAIKQIQWSNEECMEIATVVITLLQDRMDKLLRSEDVAGYGLRASAFDNITLLLSHVAGVKEVRQRLLEFILKNKPRVDKARRKLTFVRLSDDLDLILFSLLGKIPWDRDERAAILPVLIEAMFYKETAKLAFDAIEEVSWDLDQGAVFKRTLLQAAVEVSGEKGRPRPLNHSIHYSYSQLDYDSRAAVVSALSKVAAQQPDNSDVLEYLLAGIHSNGGSLESDKIGMLFNTIPYISALGSISWTEVQCVRIAPPLLKLLAGPQVANKLPILEKIRKVLIPALVSTIARIPWNRAQLIEFVLPLLPCLSAENEVKTNVVSVLRKALWYRMIPDEVLGPLCRSLVTQDDFVREALVSILGHLVWTPEQKQYLLKQLPEIYAKKPYDFPPNANASQRRNIESYNAKAKEDIGTLLAQIPSWTAEELEAAVQFLIKSLTDPNLQVREFAFAALPKLPWYTLRQLEIILEKLIKFAKDEDEDEATRNAALTAIAAHMPWPQHLLKRIWENLLPQIQKILSGQNVPIKVVIIKLLQQFANDPTQRNVVLPFLAEALKNTDTVGAPFSTTPVSDAALAVVASVPWDAEVSRHLSAPLMQKLSVAALEDTGSCAQALLILLNTEEGLGQLKLKLEGLGDVLSLILLHGNDEVFDCTRLFFLESVSHLFGSAGKQYVRRCIGQRLQAQPATALGVDIIMTAQQSLRVVSRAEQLPVALFLSQVNPEDPLAYQLLDEHLESDSLSLEQFLEVVAALDKKNQAFTEKQQRQILSRFQTVPLWEWEEGMFKHIPALNAISEQLAAFLKSAFEQMPLEIAHPQCQLFQSILNCGPDLLKPALLAQLRGHALYGKIAQFYVDQFLENLKDKRNISPNLQIMLSYLDLSAQLHQFAALQDPENRLLTISLTDIFMSTSIIGLVESLNTQPNLAPALKEAYQALIEAKLWSEDAVIRKRDEKFFLCAAPNREIALPEFIDRELLAHNQMTQARPVTLV